MRSGPIECDRWAQSKELVSNDDGGLESKLTAGVTLKGGRKGKGYRLRAAAILSLLKQKIKLIFLQHIFRSFEDFCWSLTKQCPCMTSLPRFPWRASVEAQKAEIKCFADPAAKKNAVTLTWKVVLRDHEVSAWGRGVYRRRGIHGRLLTRAAKPSRPTQPPLCLCCRYFHKTSTLGRCCLSDA